MEYQVFQYVPNTSISEQIESILVPNLFFVALIFVLFAVLLVDCEEWLCILVGFLPGARRAIVCVHLSLEQSRTVDSVIGEFLLLHLP